MSNWTSITADNLKSWTRGEVIDAATTVGTGSGNVVEECIAAAVSRVRRAVATGNTLDADTTKVPNSLVDLTCRIAIYALMRRIRFPMTDDEKSGERGDQSDLNRIADDEVKVELADTPGGSAEMQKGNIVQTVGHVRQQTSREKLRGL